MQAATPKSNFIHLEVVLNKWSAESMFLFIQYNNTKRTETSIVHLNVDALFTVEFEYYVSLNIQYSYLNEQNNISFIYVCCTFV